MLKPQLELHGTNGLRTTLKPEQILLTAHHLDDQAETFLLKLMRGGGVNELAGIPVSRKLEASDVSHRVFRPLLRFHKCQLLEYVKNHNLNWVDDQSNESTEYDRNYIRHKIIPLFRNRWPSAVESIAESARLCQEANITQSDVLSKLLTECEASGNVSILACGDPISLDRIIKKSHSIIGGILRQWLHKNGVSQPSRAHLQSMQEQIQIQEGREGTVARLVSHDIVMFSGNLFIINKEVYDHPKKESWDGEGRFVANTGLAIELVEAESGFDPKWITGQQIQLIWRKGGERIHLPGRNHSSSLKKCYQQFNIPPWERDNIPMMVIEDQIIWVYNIGICGCNIKTSSADAVLPKLLREPLSNS